MASVVIVTRQCYLLCEAINFIVVNEVEDSEPEWTSIGRKKKKKPPIGIALKNEYIRHRKPYQIIINFIPTGGAQTSQNNNSLRKSGHDEGTQVAITVQGLERCISLFQEMVAQIREQIPDQVFLDKLVEKFLIEEVK